MILEHLRLYNFRCYDNAEFRPDPRINVIIGLNGQGKTSILEAIGLIAFLRSFRNAKNSELIKFDETESSITAMVRNRDLTAQLAVKIWSNRKQATFNGKSCRYLSEYVGKISAVSFSPTDLEIIRGSPENRRVWCDKVSQTFNPGHTDVAVRYQKILDQRNKMLKMVADGRSSSLPADFDVWTEELCSWGARMIHNRIHSVDKSVDRIGKYYREISHENTEINVRYISDIFDEVPYGQQSQVSLEVMAQLLRKKLDASSVKEKILGTTTVGPHRDDLELTMGGRLARAFASQGEVRSLVLAMRLTEVEIYKTFQGLNPILLIDDFSSELDARRRKFLLDYLAENDSQVFLSTTEELQIGKTFVVSEGKISSSETIANGYSLRDGCQ